MEVVILCGGRGTRFREETEFKPKPMIEIGGRPILWHIMKIYASNGFENFILCLGYKREVIKQYFLEYEGISNDFTIYLRQPHRVKYHGNHNESGWSVSLINTGENAMTGSRVKKIERFIKGNTFMLTYGDGVADIDIRKLLQFHKEHGKIGTITGVHQPSRFGAVMAKGSQVTQFMEKSINRGGSINGGYFIFNRDIFNYLGADDDCVLEREPLEQLAKEGQLMMYEHRGFWQCMDTYRDWEVLSEAWSSGQAPWKRWDDTSY